MSVGRGPRPGSSDGSQLTLGTVLLQAASHQRDSHIVLSD